MVSTFLSKLVGLRNFGRTNRQVGTTTLLQKISEENDVIVFVLHYTEKTKFKGEVYSLIELENYSGGRQDKPYLLDNSAVQYIVEEATKLIQERTENLEAHRKTLASIKKQIEVLEGEFGETDKPIGTLPYFRKTSWSSGRNQY